jgi:hypothetical protein
LRPQRAGDIGVSDDKLRLDGDGDNELDREDAESHSDEHAAARRDAREVAFMRLLLAACRKLERGPVQPLHEESIGQLEEPVHPLAELVLSLDRGGGETAHPNTMQRMESLVRDFIELVRLGRPAIAGGDYASQVKVSKAAAYVRALRVPQQPSRDGTRHAQIILEFKKLYDTAPLRGDTHDLHALLCDRTLLEEEEQWWRFLDELRESSATAHDPEETRAALIKATENDTSITRTLAEFFYARNLFGLKMVHAAEKTQDAAVTKIHEMLWQSAKRHLEDELWKSLKRPRTRPRRRNA